MKRLLTGLLVGGTMLCGSLAMAFGSTTLFWGTTELVARNGCSPLGIPAGEHVSLVAEINYFSIDRVDDSRPILNYLVPSEGYYVFDSRRGINANADEFRAPGIDIKKDSATGDISVVGSSYQCLLTACPAFGTCE